jgi:glutaredoxin
LLFIGGDADENDHGMVPAGGGARVMMALLALAVLSGLTFRGIGQNPEMTGRFLQAMRVGQGDAVAAEAEEDSVEPGAPVNYARNNRIDIYVIAGCPDCERMRAWLDANRLAYTLYAVDSDNGAAERLHSIIAGDGQARINLPVLEVNGKVLPGNPDIGEVHRLLRQEAG